MPLFRVEDFLQDGGSGVSRSKGRPRIISNVQLVPPRCEGSTRVGEFATSRVDIDDAPDEWTRKRRNRRGNLVDSAPGYEPDAVERHDRAVAIPRTLGEVRDRCRSPLRRRRPPPTAIVSLKPLESESYAKILKKARGAISLVDLEIENPRIRRAMNEEIIIEIPGAHGASKAGGLASRLRETVRNEAQVARPTARGEVLLGGLDESITPEEVKTVMALNGGCLELDIRIRPIRQMWNGLGTV